MVKAVKGGYDLDMPLVWVAKYYDCYGYAIDVEEAAKKLEGIAYVVVLDNEDTRDIQSSADGKRAEYNGSVVVYSRDGKKSFRVKNEIHGQTIDELVLNYVSDIVTHKVGRNAPTWERFYTKKMEEAAQESSDLMTMAVEENCTLEDKLRNSEEKNVKLETEIRNLNARINNLEVALQKMKVERYC